MSRPLTSVDAAMEATSKLPSGDERSCVVPNQGQDKDRVRISAQKQITSEFPVIFFQSIINDARAGKISETAAILYIAYYLEHIKEHGSQSCPENLKHRLPASAKLFIGPKVDIEGLTHEDDPIFIAPEFRALRKDLDEAARGRKGKGNNKSKKKANKKATNEVIADFTRTLNSHVARLEVEKEKEVEMARAADATKITELERKLADSEAQNNNYRGMLGGSDGAKPSSPSSAQGSDTKMAGYHPEHVPSTVSDNTAGEGSVGTGATTAIENMSMQTGGEKAKSAKAAEARKDDLKRKYAGFEGHSERPEKMSKLAE